jgi:hypothetical protein
MIHKDFRPPNFLCSVRDASGYRQCWITHAPSEAAIRERLQGEGYVVDSVEPYDFSEWLGEAQREKARAKRTIAEGQRYEFVRTIWSRLKRHLFDLFDGKCAYCESLVEHISAGDVEHYRPKARVDDAQGHPGYFWLAYDYRNLLPCCEKCNRGRGKANHFPVQGRHAWREEELAKERPLLLNPYVDFPEEHLRFVPPRHDLCAGEVEGITPKGCKSIEVYNLRRGALRNRRRDHQTEFLRELTFYASQGQEGRIFAAIESVCSGRREYAAACMAVLHYWLETEEAKLHDRRRKAAGKSPAAPNPGAPFVVDDDPSLRDSAGIPNTTLPG